MIGIRRALREALRDCEPLRRRIADDEYNRARTESQRELADLENERMLDRQHRERRLRRNWGL